jgi:hypothetical protein
MERSVFNMSLIWNDCIYIAHANKKVDPDYFTYNRCWAWIDRQGFDKRVTGLKVVSLHVYEYWPLLRVIREFGKYNGNENVLINNSIFNLR